MAVSKRLRHEIFRRDNNTCQHCGATAPGVHLVIDHVVPVTLGGSDEPSNLQTLCDPCNSGKSATPPDAETVARVAEDSRRWAQAMQAAADNLVGGREVRNEARSAFDAKWCSWSEGRPPLPRPQGWEVSIDNFTKAGLPTPTLLDCVDIAMSKRHVPSAEVFRYMCGIAWKEVRKLHEGAQALLNDAEVKVEDDFDAETFDPDALSEAARHGLACQMLRNLSDWDRWAYFGQVREAANPYEPTTAELETTAIQFALEGIIAEREKLYDITMGFLHGALPDGKERWNRAIEELKAEGVKYFLPGDVIDRAIFGAITETDAHEPEADS